MSQQQKILGSEYQPLNQHITGQLTKPGHRKTTLDIACAFMTQGNGMKANNTHLNGRAVAILSWCAWVWFLFLCRGLQICLWLRYCDIFVLFTCVLPSQTSLLTTQNSLAGCKLEQKCWRWSMRKCLCMCASVLCVVCAKQPAMTQDFHAFNLFKLVTRCP